jgi:anti-sigma regulatory factor (Ser/Thr protein kinase)
VSGRVDEGLLERARQVVTELVSNSVRHARLAPEQKIELRVSTFPQLLWLEVIDDGDGLDPAAPRPDPDRTPGRRACGLSLGASRLRS